MNLKLSKKYVMPSLKSHLGCNLGWLRKYDNPNFEMTRVLKNDNIIIIQNDDRYKLKVPMHIAIYRLNCYVVDQLKKKSLHIPHNKMGCKWFTVMICLIIDPSDVCRSYLFFKNSISYTFLIFSIIFIFLIFAKNLYNFYEYIFLKKFNKNE